MTNLDSVLKTKDTTLWTKVHIVKCMVFPVVMYGYESWTIKKAVLSVRCSVVSDSMNPHGLQPVRFPCPWNFPGENTGVGQHVLLQRIDAFELWCWRRLLRVPWTARRSNQSILKEISPGCSLEELIVKLKLQYFRHLMRRADSFEKTPMLGKIEGKRRRG